MNRHRAANHRKPAAHHPANSPLYPSIPVPPAASGFKISDLQHLLIVGLLDEPGLALPTDGPLRLPLQLELLLNVVQVRPHIPQVRLPGVPARRIFTWKSREESQEGSREVREFGFSGTSPCCAPALLITLEDLGQVALHHDQLLCEALGASLLIQELLAKVSDLRSLPSCLGLRGLLPGQQLLVLCRKGRKRSVGQGFAGPGEAPLRMQRSIKPVPNTRPF
jgi:hypothetical protein